MNKNIKLILNYFLAPVLLLVLSWSLYKQIISQPDLPARWLEIKESWHQPLFWIVIAMVVLNWGIEAWKWKLLTVPLERISLSKAYKSVLAGCSITMLTPNRVGEFGGRILYMNEENRLSSISLTILGSISQLLVTMMFGTAGIILLKYFPSPGNPAFERLPWMLEDFLLLFSIAMTIVLGLIYFNTHMFVQKIKRFKWLSGIIKHITVLDWFSRKQLLRILLFSFLRYMVFILQYVLLLQVMDVDIDPVLCFWIISVFYLLMALAPTIGFIELPVRAAATVELLRLYSPNIIGMQAAAFGIWLINLVIPALIGSILVFGIKILKEK